MTTIVTNITCFYHLAFTYFKIISKLSSISSTRLKPISYNEFDKFITRNNKDLQDFINKHKKDEIKEEINDQINDKIKENNDTINSIDVNNIDVNNIDVNNVDINNIDVNNVDVKNDSIINDQKKIDLTI